MSSIKPKIGKCLDCGKVGPLIAGRGAKCCYWPYRSKINASKPAAVSRAEKKEQLTPWYSMQLTMAPQRCENPLCGALLSESMIINPRTVVAHILAKSKFPEVATHPLNRTFLCASCHHKYDNGRAGEMPELLVICRTRYGAFKDKVLPDNVAKIPEYLI